MSFNQHISKVNIMKSVSLLRGSKISVSDDLTKQQQSDRRVLLKGAEKARAAGWNAKLQRNSRLIVEGHAFSVNELESPTWIDNLAGRLAQPADQAGRGAGVAPTYDDVTVGSVGSSASDSSASGKRNQGNVMQPPRTPGRLDRFGRVTRSNSLQGLNQDQ